MFRLIVFAGFIISTWLWGDWRNWKRYYPTILFFILCSFYYVIIYSSYLLWEFVPKPPLVILSNNTLISFGLAFIVFPCTTLIYLGKYPKGKLQLLYIAMWVGIYTLIEVVMQYRGSIRYDHGWNLIWSIVFDIVLFTTVRLHYVRQWWGWLSALVSAVFFALIFGFPTNQP